MTSPTIQLEPSKSISFEKLKTILEKVEELKKQYDTILNPETELLFWRIEIVTLVASLLEVYEDD